MAQSRESRRARRRVKFNLRNLARRIGSVNLYLPPNLALTHDTDKLTILSTDLVDKNVDNLHGSALTVVAAPALCRI
jgi:hypothetical protein